MQAAFGAFASVALTGLFVRQQRRRIQPIFDIAIFAKPAMTAIAGLLLAVSVGYWAILVYLPLFLAAAFGWSSQTVGAVFMIATAPMLVIPVFGGQIAMRWGTRRLFLIALASLTVGNGLLTASSIATGHPSRLAWSILGMIGIGIGAGLAHPQLSGAVVALIPAEQAGMASAITVALRQGGFAVGIAALGAVLVHPVSIASFSGLFLLATVASITGVWAASRLR
jgi:MFS family permease